MKDYHINVFYSEEDRCYVADVPDLRFFGATPEAAVREVLRAKSAWLKVAKERGKDRPENDFPKSPLRTAAEYPLAGQRNATEGVPYSAPLPEMPPGESEETASPVT